MRNFILFLTLIAGLPLSGIAKEQSNVVDEHNYGDAFATLVNGAILGTTKLMADVGDARSQHQLATAYRLGTHGQADHTLALVWLKKSAAQNHPPALSEMAYHFHAGTLGLQKDIGLARHHFEQAAALGNGYAQAMLGRAYLIGEMDLLRDPETALLFLVPAAEKNVSSALVDLGSMYSTGNVVKKDLHYAKELYDRAAHLGHPKAQHNLATLLWEFPEFMDEALAIQWYEKAVAQKHAPSYFKLGEIYRRGLDENRNLTKALGLYLRGADLNDPYAITMLGYLYANGIIVIKNEETAHGYYQQAAKLGHPEAQARLGLLLMDDGVPATEAIGFEWLLKASRSDNQRAKSHLDYLILEDSNFLQHSPWAYQQLKNAANDGFVHGQVLLGWHAYREPRRDFTQALKWFQLAAENDNAEAQYALFYMHYNAQGTPLDPATAKHWLITAADNGSAEAMYGLARAYHYGNQKVQVAKNTSKALEYFRLAHAQGLTHAANELAWLLSTSPNSELRDGEEAVKIMEAAITQQTKTEQWVDTLAAAYAEMGDFDKAIHHQTEAISLAEEKQLDVATQKEFQERLESYNARQPWRDNNL